ncbi:MAG: amidohydrolase, partial [Altibacter sp.]|nr:amidohydrolase [Altibacter sp.]
MKKLSCILLLFFFTSLLTAQVYFPENDGLKEKNNNYTAFTNATVYVTPTEVIKNGTLLIQNGKVVAVGRSVTIPKNSVIVDLDGKHVYPSFIDPYTSFGIEKPKRAEGNGRSPQYEASREGYYWNDHVMPESAAISKFKYDSKDADDFRKAGFGVVNTHIMDGIARGTGVLVALNDTQGDANRILEDASGNFFSFEKSVTSRQSYPGSLMGSMALLR